ncbi:YcnI family protein [Sphingomonas sp. ID0503]|uniref:YcnI family protein n=1 Tax=Sphingomonas sp. ID0503 TaxID=3399691 RepID=UPI003AFA045D
MKDPMMRAFLALSVIAAAPAAQAHIVFAEPQAKASGYYAGFLRLSHGCGDAATVSVRVEIPEGVVSARPQPKPGWTLKVDRAPLGTPITSEGGAVIRDRVAAITWTGTLPPDQFDQFGIMMKLPAKAGPLYFPTRQACTTGSNDWVNLPAAPESWGATKMPAPMLILQAADHMDHAH